MSQFVDQAEIYVKSGKGGDGIVHFRREKYVPKGGPDGGDGGKGGDVVLVVNPHLNTLAHFRYQRRFIAESGGRGGPAKMSGKSAPDLLVEVPPGTLVYDAETGELLGDLTRPGQRLVVVRGGRGGRGNVHFASARNRVPRIAERGEPGEERRLRLELKLIADVGLVGVPNAGKSTFLARVTNARPKIAPYPFTTLQPNLGVAQLDLEHSLILADIPGLIEGAHQGIGLGHDFLRHIQRTRVLIHLLDGLSADPLADFAQINTELALFDPALASKPQIVAYNKMDMPEAAERWPQVAAALKERGYEVYPISALTGEGVKKVLWRASEILASLPPQEAAEEEAKPVYRPEEDPRAFTIERTPEGFRIHCKALERAAAMTYWEYDQSVRRFQRILAALGIEEALRAAGIQEGDTVFVGEYELEWREEGEL